MKEIIIFTTKQKHQDMKKTREYLTRMLAAITGATLAVYNFLKGRPAMTIVLGSLAGWLFFAAAGTILGWATYPAGYFQKIAFGTMAMSIISAVAWVWLGATFPVLREAIDPDTEKFKELSPWEKVRMAFWFFALYSFGAALLASLY